MKTIRPMRTVQTVELSVDREAIRQICNRVRGPRKLRSLASDLGISPQHFNHFLTGRSPLPYDMLNRIAVILNVPVSDLLKKS